MIGRLMLSLMVKCFELYQDVSPMHIDNQATGENEAVDRESIDSRLLHAVRS